MAGADAAHVPSAEGDPPATQAGFAADEVSAIMKAAIEEALQNQQWCEAKVGAWTSTVLEDCMKRLAALHRPVKWVCTSILMQKTGAGLHTAASCYWDSAVDGSRTIRWENKTMYCVTTVFGMAL